MCTLYWINVLGNFYELCILIFVISALLGITFILATVFYEDDIKADLSKVGYKRFVKVSQDLKITCELSPFIVKLESVSDLQHLFFGLGINHEMEV